MKEGFILCNVCGRIYRLLPSGWQPNPKPQVARETYVRRVHRR